jgi:hypothetical protein
VRKVRRIMLNYVAAQLDNFDNTRVMVLGADAKDFITVRTEKRMKRKTRQWEVSGLPGTDTVVSVPY